MSLLVTVGLGALFICDPSADGVTSLANAKVRYTKPTSHHVILERGGVRAVIVDNAAVDVPELPGHRAGYNGVASLSHTKRRDNVFVPLYAGLNFEHIHDGTMKVAKEKFEPRRVPMELRIIDKNTVELYQAPTPNWKLESCGRYQMLPDGSVEYTFECVPRADTFRDGGFLGFFWASYIGAPEKREIHFRGHLAGRSLPTQWIEARTPSHGVDSTHPPAGPLPELKFAPQFPLTLANHPSKYVYEDPFYYGVSHGMALAFVFRRKDGIWFAQSPTGGGGSNPAWDFQWFVRDYKVGGLYRFVMRMVYAPFESREQVQRMVQPHLKALEVSK